MPHSICLSSPLRRWLALAMLSLVAAAAPGCTADPDEEGLLVPRTVVDDPTLPSLELSDGTLLHLETHGDPGRPVVVVLHGGPGADYRSYLALTGLADQFFVVLWDQRGTGLSQRVAESELDGPHYLADLDEIGRHFSPDQRFHIIGHSWGGAFATYYTQNHPDRVDRLVLVEPGALDRAGQFFDTDSAARNRVVLGAGWDAAPATWLGYGRSFPIGKSSVQRTLAVHGSVGGALFLLRDGEASKARIGASTFLFGGAPLDVKATLVLHGQTFDNTLATGSSYGWEATLSPGWYGKRWSLAGDLSYRQNSVTHLEHSDIYRAQFPEAMDGWYGKTAGYYCATVTAAVLVTRKVELSLRGGMRVPEHLDPVAPYLLPYAMSLSSAYTF